MKAAAVLFLLATFAPTASRAGEAGPFQRQWVYASESSAVIYWQLPDIAPEALSYVEYGPTDTLGARAETTRRARWSHLHRLTGLQPGATYRYRMVVVDPATKHETRSALLTFATKRQEGAIRVPGDLQGPPYKLDKENGRYLLTRDVTADGTAFEITGANVIFDLDGHTITFGNNTKEQVFGVRAANTGKATICNGHIVQGARSGPYSAAVESRWRPEPLEVFGISTDVHLPCAYPLRGFGAAANVEVHHNHLFSRVVDLETRHYPGNDLLRMDIKGGNIHIYDNLLTEGCHLGIRLSGEGPNVEVDHNDVRHHMQYTNGYAIAVAVAGARVHHNRITSCGRGIHLTAEGLEISDNHLDLTGHQELDDLPSKSRPFRIETIELHGIKFEGRGVKNCRVHDNFVRIVQPLPSDSGGAGSPDDRIASGVYVRSRAAAIVQDHLDDPTQQWEVDRWKGYWVKYDPAQPPLPIVRSGENLVMADFAAHTPGEYTIYMKWDYVPPTPLNVACYDPDAMNEVYNNTFIALTHYAKTRHGGYGDPCQWAAPIYLVGMNQERALPGKYSIYIHDNRFVSNDVFVGSQAPVNMTVRIEKNRFALANDPPPTETHAPFYRIGPALEAAIKAGGNTFEGMGP